MKEEPIISVPKASIISKMQLNCDEKLSDFHNTGKRHISFDIHTVHGISRLAPCINSPKMIV